MLLGRWVGLESFGGEVLAEYLLIPDPGYQEAHDVLRASYAHISGHPPVSPIPSFQELQDRSLSLKYLCLASKFSLSLSYSTTFLRS